MTKVKVEHNLLGSLEHLKAYTNKCYSVHANQLEQEQITIYYQGIFCLANIKAWECKKLMLGWKVFDFESLQNVKQVQTSFKYLLDLCNR